MKLTKDLKDKIDFWFNSRTYEELYEIYCFYTGENKNRLTGASADNKSNNDS